MSFSIGKKQYKRSTGTSNKKLAEAILGNAKRLTVEGKWFEVDQAKSHTFEEMVEKFMEHGKAYKTMFTKRRDESFIKNHLIPFFKGMTLDQITPACVNQFKAQEFSKGFKPATVVLSFNILSKMFNIVIKELEWCNNNPVSKISIGKFNNKVDRWLTHEEEHLLLTLMPDWLNQICIFALNTGMRENEILSLKWTEVNLSRKTITVINTKNKEDRTIPINNSVYQLLLVIGKVRALSGYVFTNTKTKGRYSNEVVSLRFRYYVKKSEIPHCRFHDLRHTFATRLVQSGIDLYKVSKLLGHKSIKETERYAHHYPESLRDSVNILDNLTTKNRLNYPDFRTVDTNKIITNIKSVS